MAWPGGVSAWGGPRSTGSAAAARTALADGMAEVSFGGERAALYGIGSGSQIGLGAVHLPAPADGTEAPSSAPMIEPAADVAPASPAPVKIAEDAVDTSPPP